MPVATKKIILKMYQIGTFKYVSYANNQTLFQIIENNTRCDQKVRQTFAFATRGLSFISIRLVFYILKKEELYKLSQHGSRCGLVGSVLAY